MNNDWDFLSRNRKTFPLKDHLPSLQMRLLVQLLIGSLSYSLSVYCNIYSFVHSFAHWSGWWVSPSVYRPFVLFFVHLSDSSVIHPVVRVRGRSNIRVHSRAKWRLLFIIMLITILLYVEPFSEASSYTFFVSLLNIFGILQRLNINTDSNNDCRLNRY